MFARRLRGLITPMSASAIPISADWSMARASDGMWPTTSTLGWIAYSTKRMKNAAAIGPSVGPEYAARSCAVTVQYGKASGPFLVAAHLETASPNKEGPITRSMPHQKAKA